MNSDLLTKRIRKVALDLAELSRDLEHNPKRGLFFADLMKQRIFELYDLSAELRAEFHSSEITQTDSAKQRLTPAPEVVVNKTQDLPPQTEPLVPPQNKPIEPPPDIKLTPPAPVTPPPIVDPPPVVPPVTAPAEPVKKISQPETPVEPVQEEKKPAEPAPEPEKSAPENTIETEEPALTKEPATELEESVPEHTAKNNAPELTSEEVRTHPTVNPNVNTKNPLKAPWLSVVLEDTLERKLKINDITQKSQNAPLQDLNKGISISQKHEFIAGLFSGNSGEYRGAIEQIESCPSLEHALGWLENEMVDNNQWQKKERLVSEFLFLIQRRFL